MNSYQILNAWEGFCRKNPRLIKPVHHAILLHAIVVCNKLQWPEEFQFPTDSACQFIGIVDRETFNKGLRNLVDFGAIREVQPARGLHVARFVSFVDAALYLPIKSEGTPAGSGKKKGTQPPKTAKIKLLSPFVDNPPSEKEVADHFMEKGGDPSFASTFARQFISHYDLNQWTRGKDRIPLKDWKGAVRTWDPRTWKPRSSNHQSETVKPVTTPILIEDR